MEKADGRWYGVGGMVNEGVWVRGVLISSYTISGSASILPNLARLWCSSIRRPLAVFQAIESSSNLNLIFEWVVN